MNKLNWITNCQLLRKEENEREQYDLMRKEENERKNIIEMKSHLTASLLVFPTPIEVCELVTNNQIYNQPELITM